MAPKNDRTHRLIQSINRLIRLKASAILLVSLSAVGALRLDEPKLDKSNAKKRLSTWRERKGLGI